jgi:hypothetical protein
MGNKLSNDSKFTKPTGLYTNCSWDEKTVKKLIKGGKVAPRYPGQEEPGPELDKCPICFLVSLRLFSKVHGVLSSCASCEQEGSAPVLLTHCFSFFFLPIPFSSAVVPWWAEPVKMLQTADLHRFCPQSRDPLPRLHCCFRASVPPCDKCHACAVDLLCSF